MTHLPPAGALADAVAVAVRKGAAGVQVWGIGTVAVVVVGPPATVTVTYRGQSLAGVHYLTAYAPVVADVVLLLIGGGQVVVLGKLSI